MYSMIEVNINIKIYFIVFSVVITIRWSLAESAGHFWHSENSKIWKSRFCIPSRD